MTHPPAPFLPGREGGPKGGGECNNLACTFTTYSPSH
jgi:hypothetical protein